MATKTEETTVKQGNSNKNIFWLNMKAYQLLSDSSLVFSSGGNENLVETELVKSFIVRNKKVYTKYTIDEVKEYNEVLPSGKYKGLSVSELVASDRKYAIWMRDSYNFGTQENLKKEITEILK